MTRAAGRPAALPTSGYQAPQRLFLDDGPCLVRFFPERGGPCSRPVRPAPCSASVSSAVTQAVSAQERIALEVRFPARPGALGQGPQRCTEDQDLVVQGDDYIAFAQQ